MPSFRKLHTKAAAEVGQILQLNGPDGKPCGEWIRVRGIDSEHLASAQRLFRRRLLAEIDTRDKEWRKSDDYIKWTEAENRKTRAAVVMEWSFDEPCTEENILELFTQAPYVADQVDEFAGKREMFVVSSSTNSAPSQDSKLSSPSHSDSTGNPEQPSASTSSNSPSPGDENIQS